MPPPIVLAHVVSTTTCQLGRAGGTHDPRWAAKPSVYHRVLAVNLAKGRVYSCGDVAGRHGSLFLGKLPALSTFFANSCFVHVVCSKRCRVLRSNVVILVGSVVLQGSVATSNLTFGLLQKVAAARLGMPGAPMLMLQIVGMQSSYGIHVLS